MGCMGCVSRLNYVLCLQSLHPRRILPPLFFQPPTPSTTPSFENHNLPLAPITLTTTTIITTPPSTHSKSAPSPGSPSPHSSSHPSSSQAYYSLCGLGNAPCWFCSRTASSTCLPCRPLRAGRRSQLMRVGVGLWGGGRRG